MRYDSYVNLKTKISKRIREFLRRALTVEPVNQKINIGLLTSHAMSARKHSMKDLWDAEFRVFSQFGEDGIVDLLLDELQISKPRIMEIGAGDFSECNSRFALHKRNCSAYLVDMREDLQRGLQESEIRWKASVAVEIAKIDEKNEQLKKELHKKKFRKQVFNIPGNHYTYDDAKAVCKSFNAELASYQQIESSYKHGGEWCNYGWSDGQMALFPTQQNTYNNLQNIKDHEHDCGRPGINGGYIANPDIKFGVNCYGIKPPMTQDEEELMKIASPYPRTIKDIEFQKKVDHWKSNLKDISVSPFNYKMWEEV